MISKTLAHLSVVGAGLVGFTATSAAAAQAAPDDGSLLDIARPIFDAIMAGRYLAASATALVLTIALIKRYAPGRIGAFVHSDAGGALTTLGMALFGAIATATMGGATWHWSMLWTSLTVGIAAAGGYAVLKKLVVEPLLKPLAARYPWLMPVLAVVMWVFDRPTAIQHAEAEGDAAVAGSPGPGVDGALGAPEDVP